MSHIDAAATARAMGAVWKTQASMRGWTYPYISQESGVPFSSVGRILTGKQSPNFEQIAALCNLFGMSLQELLDQAEMAGRVSVGSDK